VTDSDQTVPGHYCATCNRTEVSTLRIGPATPACQQCGRPMVPCRLPVAQVGRPPAVIANARCPSCGYSSALLIGSDSCPQCGRPF
jgi:hypothetical protein